MLQIKGLSEGKVGIIDTSIGDEKRHGDNRCQLVYVADYDEGYGNYSYYHH